MSTGVPHDFMVRIKRIGDMRAELYNRAFAHGVLFALAGMGLLALFIHAGGAA